MYNAYIEKITQKIFLNNLKYGYTVVHLLSQFLRKKNKR